MKIAWVSVMSLLIACGGGTSPSNDAGQETGASDAPVDMGAPDYGSCGKAAHDCLCACGNGDCTACYNTYPACLTCINDSVTACCPSEYPAWIKCIDDSQKAVDGGAAPCAPSDTACQNARCQPEAAALQTCLGTSACKTGRSKCTGTCT